MSQSSVQAGLEKRIEQLFYRDLAPTSQQAIALLRYKLEPIEDVSRLLIRGDQEAAEEEQRLWSGYTEPAPFSEWFATLLAQARHDLSSSEAINTTTQSRRVADRWLDELEKFVADLLRLNSTPH